VPPPAADDRGGRNWAVRGRTGDQDAAVLLLDLPALAEHDEAKVAL
jgi:hypothetical protein